MNETRRASKGRRSIGALVTAGVMAVTSTGCSGGGSTADPPGSVGELSTEQSGTSRDTATSVAPSTSSTTATTVDLASISAAAKARATAVLAMSPTDQEAAIADAGMELQLAVADASGLAAELGGRDATREALLEAWAPTVSEARETDSAVPVVGFRRSPSQSLSLGEGLFGGMIMIGLGAEAASGAADPSRKGPPVSRSENNATITSEQNRGELAVDITHASDTTGVSTHLATKIAVVPCPDADGRFEAHATMDVSTSKGPASQRGVLEVDIVGQVDDDAHLVSSDMEYAMTWSRAGGGDALVEVRGEGYNPAVITRSSGGASDLEMTAGVASQIFAVLAQSSLERAAQKGWESGHCVRIDITTEPGVNDLRPGDTANVTGAPRSQIDGGPVGGNVTATLSGIQAVEPYATPVPADATFVYTAPTDNLPNHGTVILEARSRRGVGKGEVTFTIDIVSYTVSGAGAEITFSGHTGTRDPIMGFEAEGDFIGGKATFEFLGDTDAEGTWLPTGVVTINGGGNGVTVTGTGTYTMVANQDGTLTVTMQTHSCVSVGGICRDSTDVLTLTPDSN